MTTGTTKDPNDAVAGRDAFELFDAPLAEMVAALSQREVIEDDSDGIPPAANQIARLLISEAVRLIRLGSRRELTDAADALAQWHIRESAEQLEQRRPDAYRLAAGAAAALDAAASPASRGGELAVLRSAKGRAMEVMALINRAEGQVVPRRRLLEEIDFGDNPEPTLSHLLAELQAAGLITRTRTGRTVEVRLGPSGAAPHVQKAIAAHEAARMGSLREQSDRLLEWIQQVLDKPSREACDVSGAYELISLAWNHEQGGAGRYVVQPLLHDGDIGFQVMSDTVAGRPLLVGRGRVEEGQPVCVESYLVHAATTPRPRRVASRPTRQEVLVLPKWDVPSTRGIADDGQSSVDAAYGSGSAPPLAVLVEDDQSNAGADYGSDKTLSAGRSAERRMAALA